MMFSHASRGLMIMIAVFDSISILAFQHPLSLSRRYHVFNESPKSGRHCMVGTSNTEVSEEIASNVANETNERQSSDYSFVLDFTKMIENKRPGTLNTKELVLLRDSMSSIEHKSKENAETVASFVQRLLFRLISEWEFVRSSKGTSEKNLSLVTPTTNDFVFVMKLWEDCRGKDPKHRNTSVLPSAVASIMEIFKTLIDMYDETQQPLLKPNSEFFRTVLRTLSLSRERGIDEKAWRLFKQMQQKYGINPDTDMYHSMVCIAAKSREKGAAPRSEKLLREAVENFPPNIDAQGKLGGMTIDSFNVVLTAWAKSGLDYGPERAEKLIVFIEEVDNGRKVIKPTVSSFTSLIDAYAQTLEWDSISQGERVFNRVLDLFLEGDEGFEPSIVSWTIMINAWARLSKRGNRGAAARADRLLRRMESLHEEGRIGFEPDAIAYVTCMNAHAFSKTVDGARAAAEILNEMNERYLDGDDGSIPTAKSFRNVIEAWIRVDKMVEAELLLEVFEDHLATIWPSNNPLEVVEDLSGIYKSMLFGWAKNGTPEKAQDYLLDMIEKGGHPDSFCFDRVIEANTLVNDRNSMKRSYGVFARMEKCRIAGDVKPNERVYTSFIRAMTKARVRGMAQKSRVLLRRMEQLYDEGNQGIKPTGFAYNAVLLACAESAQSPDKTEHLEALKIAIEMFSELRQSKEGPDHVSFGNMLRCANLMPNGDKKDALIASIFQLCCKHGFVNQFVIRDLKSGASDKLWHSIFKQSKDEEFSVERLPSTWRQKFAQ